MKSVSIVANRCSFCILSIYLSYLDIRLSCHSNFLEYCGNPKRYLALQAKDVPKKSPEAYIFRRPFLRELFFRGAYIRKENYVSKSATLILGGKFKSRN